MELPIPLYYSNLTDHPMIQEIEETNKNKVKYDLSRLIGKRVKHFKRDIVNDEDKLKYVYRIKDFVLDANNPAKILVIYSTVYPENNYENKTWARELCEFFSMVDGEKYPNAKQKFRFEEITYYNEDDNDNLTDKGDVKWR